MNKNNCTNLIKLQKYISIHVIFFKIKFIISDKFEDLST